MFQKLHYENIFQFLQVSLTGQLYDHIFRIKTKNVLEDALKSFKTPNYFLGQYHLCSFINDVTQILPKSDHSTLSEGFFLGTFRNNLLGTN